MNNRRLAYFQLLRLPNVFTCMADLSMGFLIACGSLAPWNQFLPLLLSSACLYLAGMVLNDYFDLEVDRQERPARPLPSGRIAPRTALFLGAGLIAGGVGAAMAAGSATSRTVALLLAACILLYDRMLKQTLVGPIVMGLCRTLNILLGMSSMPGSIWLFDLDLPYESRLGTTVAVAVGLYIMGVTRLARYEVRSTTRIELTSTALGLNLGLLLVAFVSAMARMSVSDELPAESPHWVHVASQMARTGPAPEQFYVAAGIWLAVVLVVNAFVCRAIFHNDPGKIQQAIKVCIVALIGLDAAVVAFFNGPFWAGALLLLLVPTLTVGRWVYST